MVGADCALHLIPLIPKHGTLNNKHHVYENPIKHPGNIALSRDFLITRTASDWGVGCLSYLLEYDGNYKGIVRRSNFNSSDVPLTPPLIHSTLASSFL